VIEQRQLMKEIQSEKF